MKGITGIELALVGIIFTIGAVFFIIIPVIALKIHIIQVIELQYKYNNAQLTLLTLLSLTETDSIDGKTKPISQIIAEYVAVSPKPDKSFIKTKLDKMVESKIMECYILTSEKAGELANNTDNCNPSKYNGNAVISLPYDSQLTDKLTLVMD